MKVKIYQIDESLDRYKTQFCCYDSVLKLAGHVDPSIYKTVYDGNVDVDKLELIFLQCFMEPPVGFLGRPMAMSDVIELEDGTCHFCDFNGFRELKDFDTSKPAPLVGCRMLVLEPHKAPYETTIPDDLEALQKAVRGDIEVTYPFDDAFLIGNGEAKLIGLEGNRRIGNSIYAGNLLIAADDGEGGTKDLTDAQISKYTQMFQTPDDITPEEVQGDMWFHFVSLG